MIFKMIKVMLCLCAALCMGMTSVQASIVPADQVAIRGKAPHEGVWASSLTALSRINVWKDPHFGNPESIVASLEEGDTVKCLSIRVNTYPKLNPVKVLTEWTTDWAFRLEPGDEDIDWSKLEDPQKLTIPAGETMYFMMYTGEGTFAAWYNGMLIAWVEPFHIKNFNAGKGFSTHEPYWGEFMSREPMFIGIWYYVETEDGARGWIEGEEGLVSAEVRF